MAPIEHCLSFDYLVAASEPCSQSGSLGSSVSTKKRPANEVPARIELHSAASPPDLKRLRLSDEASASAASASASAMQQQPAQAEEKLAGRYSLGEAVLGSGQYGVVRECTDLKTGERLACKTVRVTEGGLQERAELRQEVTVMQRVAGHDNIVQLRGMYQGETAEEVHLVMEQCQGGELYDQIVRRERFSESDAAHLFTEMVRAVAFCHSQGVMHRDLKPENILLARRLPEGVPLARVAVEGPLVKLADFGLAARFTPGETVRGLAGSPFYIAPEVLSGEYTAKADVWSLGVILCILLTGEPPFWGATDAEVFSEVSRGRVDVASPAWAGVSAEAKSLVQRLLSKDQSNRPSAHRILTHPWIARHVAPERTVRRLDVPVEEAVAVSAV